MRHIVLPHPATVDGKPYTLVDLAAFALAVAPQFNENFEAASRGLTLKASRDKFLRGLAGPDVTEADLESVVPGAGDVWALEDEPWRKFLEWCENPVLTGGGKGYPIRPASELVPAIEALKGAKTEPPAKALPPAEGAVDGGEAAPVTSA